MEPSPTTTACLPLAQTSRRCSPPSSPRQPGGHHRTRPGQSQAQHVGTGSGGAGVVPLSPALLRRVTEPWGHVPSASSPPKQHHRRVCRRLPGHGAARVHGPGEAVQVSAWPARTLRAARAPRVPSTPSSSGAWAPGQLLVWARPGRVATGPSRASAGAGVDPLCPMTREGVETKGELRPRHLLLCTEGWEAGPGLAGPMVAWRPSPPSLSSSPRPAPAWPC